MLVLFETAAGFALFKVLDEGKLSNVEDLSNYFATSESARKVVKLKAFSKFEDTTEALEATSLLIESKPSKGLRKFLRANCEGEILAVADSKLGNVIKEKLKIDCLHNNTVMELMRGLRNQLTELISGLAAQDLAPMSLGLSHSLSRYKLKFSPDKVDTMIIQAIGLLDDLDKELNIYCMRARDWYGWHFPELTKIVNDNIQYVKAVKLMGYRSNAATLDFSEFLSEEVETALKEDAIISMGTEITDLDLENIRGLCDQVLSLSEYRVELYDYLRSRMNTIAPNLSTLVGELVGARLIAHGGSLINLAKQAGSTVQILGAEKALFKALKTKHPTPKYGLIFHASLVGQASTKFKGKIARSLAAKCALSIRYDALGDGEDQSLGLDHRAMLEARLRALEGGELARSAGSTKGKPKIEFYNKDRKKGAGGLITSAKTYNTSSDIIMRLNAEASGNADKAKDSRSSKKRKHEQASDQNLGEAEKVKADKKKRKKTTEADDTRITPEATSTRSLYEAPKEKKKKKRASEVESTEVAMEEAPKEKKKKKRASEVESTEVAMEDADGHKKKKKKNNVSCEEPHEVATAEDHTKEKKKKKHHIDPTLQQLQEAEAPNDSSTKEKKKKKHHTDSTPVQHQEAETPEYNTKEKKKKKHHTDYTPVQHQEADASEKKRQKAKKSH